MTKTQVLQQLHKNMIEQILDYAIIILEINGTILTWNKGAQAIKGYYEHEIIGQNFRLFYLPAIEKNTFRKNGLSWQPGRVAPDILVNEFGKMERHSGQVS
jgi:PAS domain S-box-containing protein